MENAGRISQILFLISLSFIFMLPLSTSSAGPGDCGECCGSDTDCCGEGGNGDATQDYCGNSIIESGEDCDIGSQTYTTSCSEYATYRGLDSRGWTGSVSCGYSTNCIINANQCQHVGFCGDGDIQATNGEQCDAGTYANSRPWESGCNSNCNWAPRCGDNIIQSYDYSYTGGPSINEECELPNTAECDGNCQIILQSYCGDGIVQTSRGEQCDAGTYANSRPWESGCNSNCNWAPRCGDNITQSYDYSYTGGPSINEECELPNTAECDSNCQRIQQIPPPYCGDGIVQTSRGEQCEPPNTNVCDSNCQIISCPACPQQGYCGDGIVQTSRGEQCDAGTYANSRPWESGCNSNCNWAPRCGDNIIQSYDYSSIGGPSINEQCDPPNAIQWPYRNDICNSQCQREIRQVPNATEPYCGDNNIDYSRGEQCEPPSTDTCDSDCHLRNIPTCANPIGWLDYATSDIILGWTCDTDNPNIPNNVHLYFGASGFPLGILRTTTANIDSEDRTAINNICGGNAAHRFIFLPDVELLAKLRDLYGTNPIPVYAWGINVGCGNNALLSGSPRFFTLPLDECDNDNECGSNQFIGNPVCQNNDVYQNFKVFTCLNAYSSNSVCSSQIDLILKQDCGEGFTGSFGGLFCDNNSNVVKERQIIDRGCSTGACFENITLERALVEDCEHECENGMCVHRERCVDNDNDGYNVSAHDDYNHHDDNCGIVDCNDNNANINPGRSDNNCNNVDDDCDGMIDEGFMSSNTSCGIGLCARNGMLVCVNGNVQNTCNPGNPGLEMCDNLDNDCDGMIDESGVCDVDECDNDNECGSNQFIGNPVCQNNDVYQNFKVFTCLNAYSSNSVCSSQIDLILKQDCGEDFTGSFGGLFCDNNSNVVKERQIIDRGCSTGACFENITLERALVEDCEHECENGMCVHRERCVDNDNDGYNVSAHDDYNHHDDNCGIVDCNDNNANINPGRSDNNCNNVDDDCDGMIDEGFMSSNTSCGIGLCARNGMLVCVNGNVQNTCNPGNPGLEMCDNLDNDCDGMIDESGVCDVDECDNDNECGSNQFIGNPVCQNNDVYQNFKVFTCLNAYSSNSVCSSQIDLILKQDCGEDFTGSFGGLFCDNNSNVVKERQIIDRGCSTGACFENITLERALVEDCEHECENGMCVHRERCVDNDNDGYNVSAHDDYNHHDDNCGIVDCNDNNANINPGRSDNNCNNVDDDCDGMIDEGFMSSNTSCGIGLCARNGMLVCVNGNVQNTCNPGNPGLEMCDNLDNDCDGMIDEYNVCTNCELNRLSIRGEGGDIAYIDGYNNIEPIFLNHRMWNSIQDGGEIDLETQGINEYGQRVNFRLKGKIKNVLKNDCGRFEAEYEGFDLNTFRVGDGPIEQITYNKILYYWDRYKNLVWIEGDGNEFRFKIKDIPIRCLTCDGFSTISYSSYFSSNNGDSTLPYKDSFESKASASEEEKGESTFSKESSDDKERVSVSLNSADNQRGIEKSNNNKRELMILLLYAIILVAVLGTLGLFYYKVVR